MSTGYQARLRRVGRWWAVDIPELAIHTQCRTLDEAEDMAREAVAEALGMLPDAVTVDLVVPEFAPLLHTVTEARRQRAAADSAERQALSEAVRTLVEDLRMSQGDACRLLGMSHQTVARLSPARGSADTRPWHLDQQPAPRARGFGGAGRVGGGAGSVRAAGGGLGGGGGGGGGFGGGDGTAGAGGSGTGGPGTGYDAYGHQRPAESRPGGSPPTGDRARPDGRRASSPTVRPQWAVAEDEL
ncbi:type II toxin-antitoxin system HicB family antitoxin [Streptomyces wuyuanensis]|uniref:type II toxin-antitoxin system HicB family antitoxin n=1 Tax=Streptomyces wuyuanensis TaxID=1196353 RepID=UPI00379F43B3